MNGKIVFVNFALNLFAQNVWIVLMKSALNLIAADVMKKKKNVHVVMMK